MTTNPFLSLAAGVALVLVSCAAPAPTSPSPEPATYVDVPTSAPFVGTPGPCAAALIGGHLIADPDWGVALLTDNGRRVELIFPYGYRARLDGGRLSLLDEFGSVVAFQGDAVVVGGGYSDLEERQWKACGGITRQTARAERSPRRG